MTLLIVYCVELVLKFLMFIMNRSSLPAPSIVPVRKHEIAFIMLPILTGLVYVVPYIFKPWFGFDGW